MAEQFPLLFVVDRLVLSLGCLTQGTRMNSTFTAIFSADVDLSITEHNQRKSPTGVQKKGASAVYRG
jgi:hypothetical protein